MAQIDLREELSEGEPFYLRLGNMHLSLILTSAYWQLNRGQKNFRPVLLAFLSKTNFSQLRAIKALYIDQEVGNYLLNAVRLMNLTAFCDLC